MRSKAFRCVVSRYLPRLNSYIYLVYPDEHCKGKVDPWRHQSTLSDALFPFRNSPRLPIMDGRPPKRQRRSVRGSESKGDSSNSISKPVALSSRPKAARARPSPAPSTRHTSGASSPSPSPSNPGTSPNTSKSKSLHTFFQPATDGQRWSSQKFEAKRSLASGTETLDADEIEDDYDSYDEIFTQHIASQTSSFNPKSSFSSNNGSTRPSVSKPKATTARRTNQSTKRFIMPPDSKSHSSRPSDPPPLNYKVDHRPWAQRFAPLNLDELAVHKRKVADVRKWLEDAFAGRGREVSEPHTLIPWTLRSARGATWRLFCFANRK